MTRSLDVTALLRQALSLPESARLKLAADLLESVDNAVVDAGATDAWAAEAKRRLVEVRSGAVKPVSWEDAEKAIFDTE